MRRRHLHFLILPKEIRTQNGNAVDNEAILARVVRRLSLLALPVPPPPPHEQRPIKAYERPCAITGERMLPVLEAAYIKPFSIGRAATHNGLLLRADIHTLCDNGLLTGTPDYRVEVSRRIQEQYGNGKEYYALHGKDLVVVPQVSKDQPGKDMPDWHCLEVYVG